MVILLMPISNYSIGGYSIGGYLFVVIHGYSIVAILLMVIHGYFIGGYSISGYSINGNWLLFYKWLLVAILLMDICCYSINDY